MTPSEVAAAIRRVSPGALPKSFETDLPSPLNGRIWIVDQNTNSIPECPDDIAEAVLIAALVQDANLARWPGGDWVGNQKAFNDADHGGSLGAAYAAWRWARGIA